eukprot:m.188685 g.188685  ORF g.188685 m.188685 type:complete len:1270 (+) comp16937_c0_seq1:170-3979(+)
MAARGRVQSPIIGRRTTDEHAAEKQMQHAMARAINSDLRPPKETAIATVIELALQHHSVLSFFRNVPRQHHINKHPVIAWKSLGVTHRLLHVLNHEMLIESSKSFIETVNYLGRLHEHDTTVYGKISSLLAQLEVAKLNFHKTYPSFDSDMASPVSITSLCQQHGKELAIALAQLQQLQIVTSHVVLDMASSLPDGTSGRHRTKEFREQACLLWPLYSVLQESVTSYEILLQLLRQLSKEEKDVFGVMRQFQDQHNKLRNIYTRVRQIPYLFARLTTLNLDGPCPDVLGESISMPARIGPSQRAQEYVARFTHEEEVKPIDAKAASARATHTARPVPGKSTSSKLDPREAKLRELREELDKANQEREDQKGIIASLQHHVQELTGGLTNVDPRAIAELQAAGLGQTRTLEEQLADLRQEMSEINAELMDAMQERDTAQAMLVSLQDELGQQQQQAELSENDLAATQSLLYDVQEQLDHHQSEATLHEKSLSLAHKENDELQSQLSNCQQQLNTALGGQSRLETELAELRQAGQREHEDAVLEHSRLQHTIETLEAELESSKGLMASQVAETSFLTDSESKLQEALRVSEAERKALEADLLTMQEKVEGATRKAIAAMEREIKGRDLNAAVRAEKLALLKQLDDITTKHQVVEARLEQMSQDHALSQEHASATEQQHKAELVRLQQDLKQSNARALKSLQDEEHISSAMEELQAQVASLQQESQELQAENAQYKSRIGSFESKSQQLESELQAATERVGVLTTSLDDARAASLTQQQELEAALEDAKTKADSKQQELKAKVNRLQTSSQAATAKVATLEEELQQQRSRLTSTKESNAGLQQQLEQMRQQHKDQLQSLQTQQAGTVDSLQSELRRTREQAEEQRQAISSDMVGQVLAGLNKLASKPNEGGHQSADGLLEACQRTVGGMPSDTTAHASIEHVIHAVGCAIMAGNTLLGRISVEASKQSPELTQRVQMSTSAVVAGITSHLQAGSSTTATVTTAIQDLQAVSQTLDALSSKYALDLEQQMANAQSAITSASARVQALLDEVKAGMDKAKLDVHEAILDQSLRLIAKIQMLTQSAGVLQNEVVQSETAAGKTTNKAQFYKRNSRWVDGLVSAAKAVGSGVSVLVDTSDKALHGEARLEEIMVCGQEIAASTAQLVSASRVKAKLDSPNKADLEKNSKQVQVETKALIEAVREACLKSKEAQSTQSYLKLSLTQAKRLQMDSQVRVLQLETELLNEQERLRQLRKAQYQLAEQTGISRSPLSSVS